MGASDGEVVRELLDATDDQDWMRVLELLSEDSFTRTSSGRIYVGHPGFARWLRDTSVDHTERWFEAASLTELGDGFVLVAGAEHQEPVRGARQVLPGAWIHHVRRGQVTAVIYFRTKSEALASLTGPGRSEPPLELVEEAFNALNRRDYVGLLGVMREDVRFSAATIQPGREASGLEELARRAAETSRIHDDVTIDVLELDEVGGGFCVAECRVRTVLDGIEQVTDATWLARVIDGGIAELLLAAGPEEARREAASRLADQFGM